MYLKNLIIFFQTSFDIWAEGTEFDINNLRTNSVTIISSPILSILPLISSLSASFIHSLSFWYSISLLNMTSYHFKRPTIQMKYHFIISQAQFLGARWKLVRTYLFISG